MVPVKALLSGLALAFVASSAAIPKSGVAANAVQARSITMAGHQAEDLLPRQDASASIDDGPEPDYAFRRSMQEREKDEPDYAYRRSMQESEEDEPDYAFRRSTQEGNEGSESVSANDDIAF